MSRIHKTSIMPFTSRQMFDLVNDIKSYPKFLPWCVATEVEGVNDNELFATMSLSWAGIQQSLTTRNTLHPGKRIDMDLVKGPFSRFAGCWTFEDKLQDGCGVVLELNYEFQTTLQRLTLGGLFKYVMYASVDAYKARARQIYDG